jgi:hypothetical protein
MAHVFIGETSDGEPLAWPVDTLRQVRRAQRALLEAGLERVEVYAGAPDCPDSYRSGEFLAAPAARPVTKQPTLPRKSPLEEHIEALVWQGTSVVCFDDGHGCAGPRWAEPGDIPLQSALISIEDCSLELLLLASAAVEACNDVPNSYAGTLADYSHITEHVSDDTDPSSYRVYFLLAIGGSNAAG